MKNSDFTMDLRDSLSIAKLNDWCWDNLEPNEFETHIISMFPLWYRYRFRCPQNLIMAALQS